MLKAIIMSLFVLGVCSFPLQGLWVAHDVAKAPLFQIDADKITTISDTGSLSMTPEVVEFMPHNGTIFLSLGQLKIEKKPSDWYNVAKYFSFLHYFKKIQEHGMLVWVETIDTDRVMISCRIGDQNWNSLFQLVRKN